MTKYWRESSKLTFIKPVSSEWFQDYVLPWKNLNTVRKIFLNQEQLIHVVVIPTKSGFCILQTLKLKDKGNNKDYKTKDSSNSKDFSGITWARVEKVQGKSRSCSHANEII